MVHVCRYTTKWCSECNDTHFVGTSRVFKCDVSELYKSGMRRDWHACANLWMFSCRDVQLVPCAAAAQSTTPAATDTAQLPPPPPPPSSLPPVSVPVVGGMAPPSAGAAAAAAPTTTTTTTTTTARVGLLHLELCLLYLFLHQPFAFLLCSFSCNTLRTSSLRPSSSNCYSIYS